MRIFVNNVDGYLAGAICASLAKLKPSIIGTRKGCSDDIMPPMVKRVVPRGEVREFLKAVSSCDVVIYDLHEADLEELELLLRTLHSSELAHDLVFILVSSVGVWARTQRDYEEVAKPVPKKEPPPPPVVPELVPAAPAGKDKDKKAKDSKEKGKEKDKKEKEKEKEEEPPPPPEPVEEAPPEMIWRPLPLSSEDYTRRIPAPKFQEWKLVETQVLALSEKNLFHPYVVCAGLPYGNGEEPFYTLFRAGWLALDTLRIIGDGKNYIPCVHVRDVASCVREVIQERPEQPYHLCVDCGDVTQKDLISGVANYYLDDTNVPSIHVGEAVLAELGDVLTLDLRMTPTSLMPASAGPEKDKATEGSEAGATVVTEAESKVDAGGDKPDAGTASAAGSKADPAAGVKTEPAAGAKTEAAQAEGATAKQAEQDAQPEVSDENSQQRAEGETDSAAPLQPEQPSFLWWSEEGIVSNMAKVAEEFVLWRQLTRMRICIVGQPGSRASKLGAIIADRYKIPHLNYEGMLEEQRQASSALGQELRDKEAEIATILSNPKSQHPPFLPASLTTQVVSAALQGKSLLSRGFVLSGYPETIEEANEIFKEPGQPAPPLPTQKEIDAKGKAKGTRDSHVEMADAADGSEEVAKNPVWPDLMVHLSGTDATCLQRFQEDRPGAPELEFKKKMDRWKKENPEDTTVFGCFSAFIDERSGERPVGLHVDNMSFDDVVDRVVEEIESKFPAIGNFYPPPSPRVKKESVAEPEEDIESLKRKSLEEEELRRLKEKQEQLEQIKREEEVKLEKHSEPLRQYLSTFVVPYVTTALIEVCKEAPEDPIGYLAEFLRLSSQESLQVPLLGKLRPASEKTQD